MAHLRGGLRAGSMSGRERYRSNTQDLGWEEEQATNDGPNVSETERMVSGVIGLGLLLRSLSRSSWIGSATSVVLGTALIHRAATGRCALYGALGIDTTCSHDTSRIGRRKVHTDRATKVEHSISIERPPEELYRFWRKLDNLPNIMRHVRAVEVVNDRLSHWTISTLPGAPTIEWDAEIINEVTNERIGWRTLHGATVAHAGSVEFQPEGDGSATRLTVILQYDPPAGPVGAAIASWLGQDPKQTIAEELSRFKENMESDRREAVRS